MGIVLPKTTHERVVLTLINLPVWPLWVAWCSEYMTRLMRKMECWSRLSMLRPDRYKALPVSPQSPNRMRTAWLQILLILYDLLSPKPNPHSSETLTFLLSWTQRIKLPVFAYLKTLIFCIPFNPRCPLCTLCESAPLLSSFSVITAVNFSPLSGKASLKAS